jgi:serine/threonine protein kinase/tetratricopeptide (TPR) repeat protein
MQVGEFLGPYQILQEIGIGGMAQVYRARQASVERDVALKVILHGIAGDPDAIQRFQREAKLIARLEHPHIVPIYDFDGASTPPYIVMRYMESGTLRDAMYPGLLPHEEVAYLIRQVSAALSYAHRQGIIHRDIKPSNILIDREGNAFVSDLGIARLMTAKEQTHITEVGAIVGTPDYMSPEQASSDEAIDHRADIYSLGVMIFEMLTGQLPYVSEGGWRVILRHLNDPFPIPSKVNPGLSPAVDQVILRATAKLPQDRFDQIAELGVALTEALKATVSSSPVKLQAAAEASRTQRLNQSQVATETRTPTEQNKSITALALNLADYAALLTDSRNTEAVNRMMQSAWSLLRETITPLGGVVIEQTATDLLAVWGAVTAHEDDMEQAIRAALAIRETIQELSETLLDDEDTLPYKIGVHRGLALITPGESGENYSASGTGITLCNLLMQNAEGMILISHEVFRSVFGLFNLQEGTPVKMRGRAEKIITYQVLAEKPRSFRILPRDIEGVETRLIGRDSELKALQKSFLVAAEDREMQALTVIGEAGIGKSRLLYEFGKWSELRPEAFWVFTGRATAAMTSQSYALIREVLAYRLNVLDSDFGEALLEKVKSGIAEMVAVSEDVSHFIAGLLGLSAAHSPILNALANAPQELNQRTRRAVIQLMTTIAQQGLATLTLEDIHFADDASLDLLNDLFATDEPLHLLVIMTARQSLYERRPNWGGGSQAQSLYSRDSRHLRIDLKPLDRRDSRELALEILQKAAPVPTQIRDMLVDRAEGNALFMEELVKMLIDDRVIVKDSESVWRIEVNRLGALRVPSTLLGLLETRYDTLLYHEKIILQRASVIGRAFYDGALLKIEESDQTHIPDIPKILERLIESGFIQRRETSVFFGNVEYVFTSGMLRDTLYERLLERQLKTYHSAMAEWLIRLERVESYSLLIADHWEKAGNTEQAIVYLKQAGGRAMQRGLFKEAVELYNRILPHYPLPNTDRLNTLLSLGESALKNGDIPTARPVLSEAISLTAADKTSREARMALHLSARVELLFGDYPKAIEFLQVALPLAQSSGDRYLLAEVLNGIGMAHFKTGNQPLAQQFISESIEISEAEGYQALLLVNLNVFGTSQLIVGLETREFDQGRQTFLRGLELARRIGHRDMERTLLGNLGVSATYAGDNTAAIRYTEEGLRVSHEIGNLIGMFLGSSNLAEYYADLKQTDKARGKARDAFKYAIRVGSLAYQSVMLNVTGWIEIQSGHIAQGLELLGIVRGISTISSEGKLDTERWIAHCRTELAIPDSEVESYLERGKGVNLETGLQKVAALLAE